MTDHKELAAEEARNQVDAERRLADSYRVREGLNTEELAAMEAMAARIAELEKTVRELLIAIEFNSPPVDFGTPEEPSPGYEARVPVQFVTDARAALTREPGNG